VCGSLIQIKSSRSISTRTDVDVNSNVFIYILCFLSLIYIVLSFKDIISKGLSFNQSLGELRAIFFEDVDDAKELGIESIVKGVSKSIAILYIALLPYFKSEKSKRHFYLAIITLAVIFIDTALQGGRTFFIYAIVLIFISYNNLLLANGKVNPFLRSRKQLIRFSFIGLLVFIGLFGVFPAMRNPKLVDAVNTFVGLHHKNAKVSENIVAFVDKNEYSNGLLALSFGSTYFSAPLVKFNYYYSDLRVYEWEGNGVYNFPIFEKMFTLTNKKHFAFREDIKVLSLIDGNDSNPWSTGFRDFSIDFGRLGGIFFCFISSFFFRKSYNLFFEKKNYFMLLLSSLTSFFSFLIPFYSPYIVLGQSLIILIILYYAYRFLIYIITTIEKK
jgi:hypothetical protein